MNHITITVTLSFGYSIIGQIALKCAPKKDVEMVGVAFLFPKFFMSLPFIYLTA